MVDMDKETEAHSVTVSDRDAKLLEDVKKSATKKTDAVVKMGKDGSYNVYQNRIGTIEKSL